MSIQKNHRSIQDILLRIEEELRRLDLWSECPPAPEAFASTQPFCYDTMAFEQWLQWVFMARMGALLEGGGELPMRSQIAPLAELAFQQNPRIDARRLVALIADFDTLVNDGDEDSHAH